MQQILTHLSRQDSVRQALNPGQRKALSLQFGRCAVGNCDCAGDIVWNEGHQLPLCWYHNTHDDDKAVKVIAGIWGRKYLQRNLERMDREAATVVVWMLVNGLADQIPQSLVALAAGQKEQGDTRRTAHGDRDTNARYQEPQLERLRRKLGEQSKLLNLSVLADNPNAEMMRPKSRRWESGKYLAAVRRLPCVVCDGKADHAHHLIGHGQGKMGSKAHDLLTMPLCAIHHSELHQDVAGWERCNGSQLEHVITTQSAVFGLGWVE
ncbi:DUF968 domain-containing protein [Ferrimonas balearica]|uniref:DUF968 domain-containing protein n=1 Tax=Ferrimonas balearica TaxID=44012 RepID=UPI001C94E8A1|nr:DUF968 domain-containing protein [Ferrimonas balearica]MBY6104889.1 DUF968 domain-containing protein [Ferrimonas balearica]